MAGTTRDVTRPTRIIPPRITDPTSTIHPTPRPRDQTINAVIGVQQPRELINLEKRQTTDHATDGENNRERFGPLAETDFKVIHRSALIDTVLVLLAIKNSQGAGEELGRHADQSGYPHPENSSRAADSDSDSHAGDVADADSCRERRRESLKVSYLARVVGVVVFASENADSMADIAERDKTADQRKVYTGADQKVNQPGPSGEINRSSPEVFEYLQQTPLYGQLRIRRAVC